MDMTPAPMKTTPMRANVFLPGYHVFILDAFQLGLFQIAKFCKLF